jgi:hypothetical protein
LKHYAYPYGRISAIFKNHLSSLQRVSTVPVFSYLWKREDQQPPTRDKRNAALRDGTTPITGTLVASNFGFGQTRKFRLFQSRFLATLLEDCYWKVV